MNHGDVPYGRMNTEISSGVILILSFPGFYESKKSVRLEIYQKNGKKLSCMYTETSSSDIRKTVFLISRNL